MFKFANKNILIISPEPWDHIFVSKHHYAVHLGKRGNRVYFLNPPSHEMTVAKTEAKNVFSVTYKGFIPGLRFLPRRLQKRLIRSRYEQIQKLCSSTFDVVWSFDNSVFFDFCALPEEILAISHIVDLNQNFQTLRSATTADFCLASTEAIKNRLLKYNSKVFKIHHGFNQTSESHPVHLPGSSPIKIIYAGNLSMPYIDWKTLYAIVKSSTKLDFLFIGPDFHGLQSRNVFKTKVLSSPAVFQLGKIDADLLPAYLKEADILLVCYQEKYFADQANPHKMMEYLGAGCVVVSTFTAEFSENNGLIEMATSNESMSEMFSRVVNDLDHYNDKDLVNRRRAFAREHTYDRQIDRVEKIINDNELVNQINSN